LPWTTSSTAGGAVLPIRLFKVIHPFHPLYNREFELLYRKQDWGEDRVFFHDDKGQVRSITASWTDVIQPSPFVFISAGRALFQTQDLVELTRLVDARKIIQRPDKV
jgi:hypothetical protein